jgi:hypothetical protein
MKNLIKNTLIVVCIFLLVSCSGNGPDVAATKFFENLNSGNFDEAKKYSTTDTKSMLSMMESFGAQDQLADLNTNTSFEVIDTKETENTAICTLKITDNETGDVEDMPLHLVKKDGEWLVDMNKEDMDKEGMEDMDKEGMPGMEDESDSPAFKFDDYEN